MLFAYLLLVEAVVAARPAHRDLQDGWTLLLEAGRRRKKTSPNVLKQTVKKQQKRQEINQRLQKEFPVSVSALRFCSEVISFSWQNMHKKKKGNSLAFQADHVVQKELDNALETCQKVLAGSLPDERKAWAVKAVGSSGDGSHEFGRLQSVVDKERSPAWKTVLKEVCRDECVELVQGIKDSTIEIYEGIERQTAAESCADNVVRRVEAHILGCCADTCGWNGVACALWPFFTTAEKSAWESECCTEWNVLQGSDRERMCDATLTEKQKNLAEIHDLPKDDTGAVLIGQDERLMWTDTGSSKFSGDHVQGEKFVSQEFLLKPRSPQISIQQGLRDGWWIREAPTRNSLLEIDKTKGHVFATGNCQHPFDTVKWNAQRKAEGWSKITLRQYGTYMNTCGRPASGTDKDDVSCCNAFVQSSVDAKAKCFELQEGCKIFQAAPEKLKTVEENEDPLTGMVFLRKSQRPESCA